MSFDRAELDEMISRWEAGNLEAERLGDWTILSKFYTEEATYGWNYGPTQDFMAVGNKEIRDIALGQEMLGLEGWSYPYQEWVVDEKTGSMIGLWKQIADATRPDGSHYEVTGIGGSWFRYAGNFQFSWQRDFFDFGNVSALFMEMITDGALTDGMTQRIQRATSGTPLPGWYPVHQAPVKIW